MAENSDPHKSCFLVGPIGSPGSDERKHADWLLQAIVEPVFAKHFANFKVERADKIAAPGMINSQVINRLLNAELVIADMSFLNANAFYEMGIRHMKQGPIIHMYKVGGAIPFDVAPHRAIPFSYDHPDHLTEAQAKLRDAADEVLKPGFQIENPVTTARGVLKLEEHATPEYKVLFDQMSTLRAEVELLRLSSGFAGPGFGGPSPRPISHMGLLGPDLASLANVNVGKTTHIQPLLPPEFRFFVSVQPGKLTEVSSVIKKAAPDYPQTLYPDEHKLMVRGVSDTAQAKTLMTAIEMIEGVTAVHSLQMS